MDKVNVTISIYFEVKNAELFGGEGSIGYMEQKMGITLEKSNKPDLYKYAKESIKNSAKMLLRITVLRFHIGSAAINQLII